MVISYTDDDINNIINDKSFKLNYLNYKNNNKQSINKLKLFFNSLDVNKNYYKMNISSKNIKFKNNLSSDTIIIKYINNELNKVTNNNIDDIIINITKKIDDNLTLYPLIIDNIINKCIFQLNYIDHYIKILKYLLNKSNVDIDIIINKNIEKIYYNNIETENNYDNLCEFNKNIDASIGLSIFIIKLEINNIIKNYSDNIINKLFILLKNINNDDIIYKYIISLYNIFTLLDNVNIKKYKTQLEEIKSQNISKRNKFKIMDILELCDIG